MSFLSSWRSGRLLLAWCAYWLALLLALVGPAIPALFRISREGASGTASATIGNGGLQMSVSEGGNVVWSLDINLILLVAAVAVPPLVLWALWLRAQSRERAAAGDPMPNVQR